MASQFPGLFEKGLQIVSTNFVFLYLLCILSYVVYSKSLAKKLLGLVLAVLLVSALTSSGWLVLYPISLVIVAATRSRFLRKQIVAKDA
jgi:hypothetical protein